jgi:hypothetical protein
MRQSYNADRHGESDGIVQETQWGKRSRGIREMIPSIRAELEFDLIG